MCLGVWVSVRVVLNVHVHARVHAHVHVAAVAGGGCFVFHFGLKSASADLLYGLMFGHPGGRILYATAAPLLFPHVPEWGGLGAARFFGVRSRELLFTLKRRQKGAFCSAYGARRAEHRRARAGDLLRATFAARGRSMHRRGP